MTPEAIAYQSLSSNQVRDLLRAGRAIAALSFTVSFVLLAFDIGDLPPQVWAGSALLSALLLVGMSWFGRFSQAD